MDQVRQAGLKGPWAVRLPEEETPSAGRLRLRPGLEICAAGDGVWIRGPVLDTDMSRQLRGLPGAVRFRVDEDGRLTRVGKRLPQGRLPDGPWTPLAEWIAPKPQAVLRAANPPKRAPLGLIRCDDPIEPGAVLVAMPDWEAFALCAPEIRLRGLKFAVSADGRVLVIGRPVPALRGERLVDRDGVLVPCGLTWDPPVDASELRAVLGAGIGDVVAFAGDGRCDLIEGSSFVRASRSAVRLSSRAVQGG